MMTLMEMLIWHKGYSTGASILRSWAKGKHIWQWFHFNKNGTFFNSNENTWC